MELPLSPCSRHLDRGCVMQIIALFRSLRIADNNEIEYGKTVGWFVASAVVLLIAVLVAVVVASGAFDP